MSESPAIELRGISKSFGAVQANRDIDLTVTKGTIHGIVGENGAGKSTLMSILYGYYTADAGEIRVGGQPVRIATPADAIRAGIGMVHQHFMLVDDQSVIENVMLGSVDGLLTAASLRRTRAALDELGQTYGLKVDPDAIVETLPVGLQQRVAILRAMVRRADVLILDEPTGVLTPTEADDLFRVLGRLRDEGRTVILITHKLREIMAITDMVSVLRRGEMIATRRTADTSPAELAELMVGRRVQAPQRTARADTARGPVRLSVRDLALTLRGGARPVKDLTFDLRAGEILGIAGVAGNGQSELLELLAGTRRPTSGDIRMRDRPITALSAGERRKLGLAHIPEDRHHTGLVLPFALYENAVLGTHRDPSLGRGPFLSPRAMRDRAAGHVATYDIRPPDPALRSAGFSGGNQQKIVVAREIERGPDVILIGQPTRGVDIGAIEFIHRRMLEQRDAGKAILLVSVELDEVRALSDRILVMFDGRLSDPVPPETDERTLGLMMAGMTAP
jgi:simple sugar transport system ATP-binding protein